MNKRITRIAILSLIAAGLAPMRAHAGGALVYNPSGAPVVWDNSQTITYNLGTGKLGTLNNTRAALLITNAFQAWSSIPTAKLDLQEGDVLNDQMVNGATIFSFLNSLGSATGANSNIANPVFIDTDGSITEALFGTGASLNVLAAVNFLSFTPTHLTRAAIVLNGRAMDGKLDPDDVSQDDMTRAVTHAVGIFLGLGDSDLNDALIFDGNSADAKAVPVMHPGSTVNNSHIPILGGGSAPTLEDQMWISTLYPADNFAASVGTIQGQLLLPDGTTVLQGIDVIARKVDDPVNTAVSAFSGDSFFHIDGSVGDPSQRGAFTMNVPPGSYTLEFRPLRLPIGPLGQIFPLPGGAQFYQAPSGTPAPSAGPATATPITVTAGQTTTIKFVAAGKAALAPQTVTQVKPDDAPTNAQLLPLSATVTGNVAPTDPGQIVQYLGTDPGTGLTSTDKIENLYRVVVTEPSIITLFLQPAVKENMTLYWLSGFRPDFVAALGSYDPMDTAPRSFQTTANPGTYFIGVSLFDAVTHPVATGYTLSLITTPLGSQPTPIRPVLNQLIVGNITNNTADATWLTDANASTVGIVAAPIRQQLGDPTATTTHHVAVTGLTPSTFADFIALSQNADGNRDTIPKVYFHAADTAAATGPANIQAAVTGLIDDFTSNGTPTDTSTKVVAITLLNPGAPATSVQITGLTPSPGWKLAVPLTQPLTVGGIGSNGTAVVAVRLLRDGTGPAPLPIVTGAGTFAGAGGAAANFTIGP